MHELGIMIEVAKQVERAAKLNKVKRVEKVVLQIGELSTVIPYYVRDVWPAAIDGTSLEGTKIEIETIRATGRCKACHVVFELVPNQGQCPHCRARDFEEVGGREFLIKELVVED